MEFLVKLIYISKVSSKEAKVDLEDNCTLVQGNYWLFEGETEFLRGNIDIEVIGERAVEAYGGLPRIDLIRMVRENYDVPPEF